MIWADRIAVVWAVLVLAFIALSGSSFMSITAAFLWLAGPWIVLRGVHFMATGRIGRKPSLVTYRVLPL